MILWYVAVCDAIYVFSYNRVEIHRFLTFHRNFLIIVLAFLNHCKSPGRWTLSLMKLTLRSAVAGLLILSMHFKSTCIHNYKIITIYGHMVHGHSK